MEIKIRVDAKLCYVGVAPWWRRFALVGRALKILYEAIRGYEFTICIHEEQYDELTGETHGESCACHAV